MILIVEDERDTRVALVRMIQLRGREVIGVANGAEALMFMATALPELVVLDYRMPGVDGMEVLRRMRAEPRTAGVPVVFFSAEESGLLREEAMSAGAQDYIRKGSMHWEDVLACIERHGTPRAVDPTAG